MLSGFVLRSIIRNPHKFNIKSEMDGRYYNLWSTDNDKTDANDEVVIKSVYDPSPVGYSLPASNAFTGFTTTGQNVGVNLSTPLPPEERAKFNVKGNWDKGYYFYTKPNKQGNTFFFPASGWRHCRSSILYLVSKDEFCWDAGPYSLTEGRRFTSGEKYISPLDYFPRSSGFSVRSAEEREWRCVL